MTKAQSESDLAYYIGENLIKPDVAARYPDNFPERLNPFSETTAPEWKEIMVWNSFSPRLGLNYDLFGNGKTSLKTSFSQYSEYLMLQYFSTLHPFYPRSFGIYWKDTTAPFLSDTYPGTSPWEAANIGDHFYLGRTDYREMDPEFAKKKDRSRH